MSCAHVYSSPCFSSSQHRICTLLIPVNTAITLNLHQEPILQLFFKLALCLLTILCQHIIDITTTKSCLAAWINSMTAHTYPWKLRSASAMGILRSTGITPWLTFSSCIIFLCLLWALLSPSGLLCSICNNESAGDLCVHWRTAVFSFLINCTKAVNNYIIRRTFNYRHRPYKQ